jgi:hypothetical protein
MVDEEEGGRRCKWVGLSNKRGEKVNKRDEKLTWKKEKAGQQKKTILPSCAQHVGRLNGGK